MMDRCSASTSKPPTRINSTWEWGVSRSRRYCNARPTRDEAGASSWTSAPLLWKRASWNWRLYWWVPLRAILETQKDLKHWLVRWQVLDCIFNSTDPFKWFYTRDITIYIVGNTINDDILVTRYIFIKTKAVIAFLYDKYGNLEQWELKLKVLTLNNI